MLTSTSSPNGSTLFENQTAKRSTDTSPVVPIMTGRTNDSFCRFLPFPDPSSATLKVSAEFVASL